MTDFVVRLFESLGPVGRLFPYRRESFIQFVKFAMVGVVSSLINLALLFSLTDIFLVYYLHSAAVALLISAVNGYLMNHHWTFKSMEDRKHHFVFSKYLVLNISTYFLNLAVLVFLVENFGIWYIIAEVMAIFVALIGNFFGSKYWVFK
jgi:putative flippase GtrA